LQRAASQKVGTSVPANISERLEVFSDLGDSLCDPSAFVGACFDILPNVMTHGSFGSGSMVICLVAEMVYIPWRQ
jgi:hypothetical protein